MSNLQTVKVLSKGMDCAECTQHVQDALAALPGVEVESFTTERARRAAKDLAAMAPQTARIERDGAERH